MNDKSFRTQVIVIKSIIEAKENGKTYMQVIDEAGKRWKFKQGKDGALKEKWPMLQEGHALQLVIGKFKGYNYIEDFNMCSDTLKTEATKKAQEQQKDSKEASIEAQVAVKAITDLQIAGIVTMSKDLLEARDSWLRHALREFIK